MNAAVTAGTTAAIIASQARSKVIKHFEKAGALSHETAVPMPEKTSRYTVNALIKHKVLVPVREGLFYLDQEADARFQREQGNVAIAVIIGLRLVLGIVIIGVAATR